MVALKVGDQAPDFSLANVDGSQWSLSEARGKKGVILSFHVLDFTGDDTRGCACQVNSWKAAYPRIQAAGGEVVEVSADSRQAHQHWSESLGGLPFPLLADFTKRMTTSYGILNEETGAPRRSVFVVDKHGVLRYANTSFNASDPSQYEEAIGALEGLK